jgi:hypothetical protein
MFAEDGDFRSAPRYCSRHGEFQVFAPAAEEEDQLVPQPRQEPGFRRLVSELIRLPGESAPDPLAAACAVAYIIGFVLLLASLIAAICPWVLLAGGAWACMSSAAGWQILHKTGARQPGKDKL